MSPTGEYHYFYCQIEWYNSDIKELFLKLHYDWNESHFKDFILFKKFIDTEEYYKEALTNMLLIEDELNISTQDYIDNLYIFCHINGLDVDFVIEKLNKYYSP